MWSLGKMMNFPLAQMIPHCQCHYACSLVLEIGTVPYDFPLFTTFLGFNDDTVDGRNPAPPGMYKTL